MAIINSGFSIENPMDLTEPLEKLIKVGFGLSRDEPVEEIEVELDDEEDGADEEDVSEGDMDVEEIDLSTLDEDDFEGEATNDEL